MDSRRFEQIKEMGRAARRAGKKRETCPYRLGSSTTEYDAWLLGFDEADRDAKSQRGRR